MRSAGVSDNELSESEREIEQTGQTVLESTSIIEADLKRVLEPHEDLGKVLIDQTRQGKLQ